MEKLSTLECSVDIMNENVKGGESVLLVLKKVIFFCYIISDCSLLHYESKGDLLLRF